MKMICRCPMWIHWCHLDVDVYFRYGYLKQHVITKAIVNTSNEVCHSYYILDCVLSSSCKCWCWCCHIATFLVHVFCIVCMCVVCWYWYWYNITKRSISLQHLLMIRKWQMIYNKMKKLVIIQMIKHIRIRYRIWMLIYGDWGGRHRVCARFNVWMWMMLIISHLPTYHSPPFLVCPILHPLNNICVIDIMVGEIKIHLHTACCCELLVIMMMRLILLLMPKMI